jgi:hypothetical protein
MASRVDLELKLVSQSEQILKRLEALEDGLKVNIELSLNGSKVGGNNLQKQLQESLGNKEIELKNFSVSAATGNKVRKILEEYINDKPINLTNFSIGKGTANQLRNIIETNLSDKSISLTNLKLAVSSTNSLVKELTNALSNIEINIKRINVDPAAIQGLSNRISGGGAGGDIFEPSYGGKRGTPGAFNVSLGGSAPQISFGDQGLANSINAAQLAAEEARIKQAEAEISARARRIAVSEGNFRRKREQDILLNRSRGFEQVDINDLGSALRGFNQTEESRRAEEELQRNIDAYRRKVSGQPQGPFSDINEGRRQEEARQRAIDDFRRKTGFISNNPFSDISRIDEARSFYNSSFFNSARTTSRRFGVPESAFGPKAFFDSSRLDGLGDEIGQSALFGLASGQGVGGVLGSTFGSLVGGSIGGSTGARLGGALGGTIVAKSGEAFASLAESLISAAEAGIVFQRSVLGITATFVQTRDVLGPDGQPLSIKDQVEFQRNEARNLQLQARRAFADVGIGGQAESSIVQSVATALGSKGLNLTNSTTVDLAQGLGAAVNILAPELATNPAVLRKDIFDILAGLGQAGRTALGSRTPRLVDAISTAQSEDDIKRVIERELKPLVETFKNDTSAATQISRINSSIDNLQTSLGTGIVDKLGTSFKKLADVLSSEQLQSAASKFGENIGNIINGTVLLAEKLINLADPLGILGKTPETELGKKIGLLDKEGKFNKENKLGVSEDTFDSFQRAYKVGKAFQETGIVGGLGAYFENFPGNGGSTPLGSGLTSRAKPEIGLARSLSQLDIGGIDREGLALPSRTSLVGESAAIRRLRLKDGRSAANEFTDLDERLFYTQLLNEGEINLLAQEADERAALEGSSLKGSLVGSRTKIAAFGKQQELAQESVNNAKASAEIARLGGNAKEYTLALGVLANAEKQLASVRERQNAEVDKLIASENALAQLRASAVDRTTASGKVTGAETDLANSKSQRDRLLNEARRQRKLGNINDAETRELQANALTSTIAQNEDSLRQASLGRLSQNFQFEAGAIDQTSASGRLDATKLEGRRLLAEQTTLRLQARFATNPERRSELERQANALQGARAQNEAQQQLQPLNDAQNAVGLTQTVIGAEQSLRTFGLTVDATELSLKKVNSSLADLDKQTRLNSLTGERKARELVRNYQKEGGVIDQSLLSQYEAAFGENAAQSLGLGNGTYDEILNQNISKRELSLFLDQNERGRRLTDYQSNKNALLQQKSSLEFQERSAPLNYVSNQIQLAKGLTELSQLAGGGELATAAATARSGISGLFDERGNINVRSVYDRVGAQLPLPSESPSVSNGSGPALGGNSGPMATMTALTDELKNLTAALRALIPKLDPDNIGRGVANGIAREFNINN